MKVGIFHMADVETPHVALAGRLIRSVRARMPGVEIVHLTDADTEPLVGVDTVCRQPCSKFVALACLELFQWAGVGDWLFLDSDTIVQRDVSHVFDQAFDIAVADREGTLLDKEIGTKFMARMPYNAGVVFSRSPAFWVSAVARLAKMPVKRHVWMGDQEAMNRVIADGGYRVLVLSNDYNYPPKHEHDDISGKAIIHLKGPRKSWALGQAA